MAATINGTEGYADGRLIDNPEPSKPVKSH